MKIINKPRGTGKTVELIHVSEVTGARIITHTLMQAEFIREKAKELNCTIPMPMSIQEIKQGISVAKARPYLIDDIDCWLDYILEDYFGKEVLAVTMSVKESGESND